MIGLGVGIDYSLFIVTRHRENLRNGMEVDAAAGHAVATAGQAVIFAGTTVVIAICGLALSGIPYVAVLGFTSALVVAVMMVAAITLLPAFLGLAGPRINSLRVRGLHIGHHRSTAANDAGRPTFWARFATSVARHRWPCAIGAVIVLLALAAPFLSIRYGQPDDGTAPSSTTQHQAFELLAQGFGPGVNGPLAVVVTFPKNGEVPPALLTALRNTPGVASVAPPRVNTAGNTAVVTVIPTTAPDAQATSDLVAHLRSSVVPPALKGTQAKAYVGGVTAAFIDLGNRIADRLPLFVGAVVLLSFLLLMMVFRSIVIPATAAAMNLLSVGAAYGVTVAVFQWGWAKGLIGLESTVPIVSFVPMMMFAVLFGLSMDYQVFLLTRGPRGVRRQAGDAPRRRHRRRDDGTGHHVGRADHDQRVPELRGEPGARAEDVRTRPRRRRRRRRDDRPHGARAGPHGDPRPGELVVPEVARRFVPKIDLA